MSLFMSLDCPHCLTLKQAFWVDFIREVSSTGYGPSTYVFDVSGHCGSCKRSVVVAISMEFHGTPNTKEWTGDLLGTFFSQKSSGSRLTAKKLWQAPKKPKEITPSFLPDRVLKPYLEAEKAFLAGLWNAAAAGYRKAVERAISPLITNPEKTRMLGPRIGELEKSEALPEVMLSWIRIVKNDANFALHDNDHDFEKGEEIEPAREFAYTLLTYLYTLPAKVRIAQGLPPEEQKEQ